MFTGIVEEIGIITKLEKKQGNLVLTVKAKMTPELQIDQSVCHNGACLTVVSIEGNEYTVVAIEETLEKTNLGNLEVGDPVNLERAMQLNGRLDGHMVQGHVDQTAVCTQIENLNGSWAFHFKYESEALRPILKKGSITIDGVSLTVVDNEANTFSVAIIPYTFEHTIFNTYKVGREVNLEFDLIGKYVSRYMANVG